MLPEMRFFGPYPGAAEIHASLSFMPSPALRTVWFGSYQGDTFPAKMRGMPWKMLAEGMNAVAWWPAGVEGAAGLGGPAALRPDYLPLGHFALASAQIREIQSGIGRLLLSGTRLVQPIAVYYSNACLHAATIRPKETLWESSLQDFSDVLHDAGYEYRYLSPDDLLDGRWRDLKALILPYSQALSPREGKVLREFVAAGGLLLADFAPGIMDGHGRLLAESSLKDLFGEFTRLHVQRQGAGNAVYLADYVKGYQDKRRAGEAAGVAAGVARLLQELAGVAPAALIQDAEGRPRQDVTCAQFQHGSASYLLVVRDFLSTESDSPAVRLALPHRAQVYEVREARDLGETDRVDMSLAPGGAQVLALLPAKAAAIEATVSPRRAAAGDRVRLRVRVRPEALAGAGLGVRVEVLNPAGSPIPWYARTVVLTDGTGTATLTLARNELPGTYTFVARELASGNTARATLAVR
jgi:hypothetical protein